MLDDRLKNPAHVRFFQQRVQFPRFRITTGRARFDRSGFCVKGI